MLLLLLLLLLLVMKMKMMQAPVFVRWAGGAGGGGERCSKDVVGKHEGGGRQGVTKEVIRWVSWGGMLKKEDESAIGVRWDKHAAGDNDLKKGVEGRR